MAEKKKISIEGKAINIINSNEEDYISLTDMAKSQHQEVVIFKWMSLKSTIEYMGEWESLYNPNFNYTEFGIIKNEAGTNSFVLSTKNWLSENALGILAKPGRYGGTYAHKDIAFHFGMWISAKFQLLLVKEFQRLKEEENDRQKLDWNLQRTLAKINYTIHTDAIKERLIPAKLNKQQISQIYASEADLLNMALFSMTAADWRQQNPEAKGNMRDQATLEQLVVLSNLESINAALIRQGITQSERLQQLNQIAITQMTSLVNNSKLKKLK